MTFCVVNETRGEAVSVIQRKGLLSVSAVASVVLSGRGGMSNSLVVLFDIRIHIIHATIAVFDRVFVEGFVVFVVLR